VVYAAGALLFGLNAAGLALPLAFLRRSHLLSREMTT
jgi:hypothetical protein